jgi:hypothetical protein
MRILDRYHYMLPAPRVFSFTLMLFASLLFPSAAAYAQPPDPIDTAAEIVARAMEARDAIHSGKVTYREIIGTVTRTESTIRVVFGEGGIRTERANSAPGGPDSRQGGIRNGSLWTQYSGGGSDPVNWRLHSEVYDPSEDSEATAASYDPRQFRMGAFPRAWAPRTRVRELMSLPAILLTEAIATQTPTGDWLVAGKRKRPFDAEIVFDLDERRGWSLVNIQVTRRVPLADGAIERWVHRAVIEPAQFGEVWFPGKYVWTKEVDGKLKQRCELVTSEAEFNIEVDPMEFTLRGIKGLPNGVKVTRNFEGNETRVWNGAKLVDPTARP